MDKNKKNLKTDTKQPVKVLFLTAVLILLAILSLLALLQRSHEQEDHTTALIYQDGELVMTIRLFEVTDTEVYTLRAKNGGFNEITVTPGKIAITDADCPDKLCMNVDSTSKLPIICLPHNLVITFTSDSILPTDAVTY